MATTLIKKADALAAYLNQNCLTEDRLNALDILDSLASLGSSSQTTRRATARRPTSLRSTTL